MPKEEPSHIDPTMPLTLLRSLCSKEELWFIAFASNDSEVMQLIEGRGILGSSASSQHRL